VVFAQATQPVLPAQDVCPLTYSTVTFALVPVVNSKSGLRYGVWLAAVTALVTAVRIQDVVGNDPNRHVPVVPADHFQPPSASSGGSLAAAVAGVGAAEPTASESAIPAPSQCRDHRLLPRSPL